MRTRLGAWFFLSTALASGGCISHVLAQYEAEKSGVLGQLQALPEAWPAEIRVRLSEPVVETIVEGLVDGGLLTAQDAIEVSGPLGMKATLEPRIQVKSLKLGATASCSGCVGVEAELHGTTHYALGALDGDVPIEASFRGAARIDLTRTDGAWSAELRLEKVEGLDVDVPRAGKLQLDDALLPWIQRSLQSVPPIPLGTFGGEDLPLRAMRLAWSGDALELQGAIEAQGAVPVSEVPGPTTGWVVSLHEDTALAILRRAAFDQGVLTHDVAADPRGFSVDDAGTFTLDLRLWRLKGAGWWRDYAVTGHLAVDDGSLVVAADSAVEGDKSKGAGLVDPLVLLVEGRILDALVDALAGTVPLRSSTHVGKRRIVGEARSIDISGDTLSLRGVLEDAGGTRAGSRLER